MNKVIRISLLSIIFLVSGFAVQTSFGRTPEEVEINKEVVVEQNESVSRKKQIKMTVFPPSLSIGHDCDKASAATVAPVVQSRDTTLRRVCRTVVAAGIGVVSGGILAEYEKKECIGRNRTYGSYFLRTFLLMAVMHAAVTEVCSDKETSVASLAGVLSYMASW